MKFICDCSILQNVIQNAQEFCSQKVAITSFVYLKLSNNNLNIRSTDSKMGYETNIGVKGEKNGELIIPCDKFNTVIKSFSEGNIIFEQKTNDYVLLKSDCSASSFKIRYNEASSFPNIELDEGNKYLEIDSNDLISMINQTIISVNDNVNENDSKAFFNGILMEEEDKKLSMVATDGRSMSFIEKSNYKNNNVERVSSIIPSKFLKLFIKICRIPCKIKIYINENSVFLVGDNYKLYTSLYKGTFPNYRKVLGMTLDKSVIVKVEDMNRILRRVSIMADKESKRIVFSIEKGKIIINSSDNEIGSATDEMKTDYDGEDVQFGINYTYIQDQVRVITSDYLKLSFKNSETQIRIQPTGDEEYTHVIMPMSI